MSDDVIEEEGLERQTDEGAQELRRGSATSS